jgi:POT family proton-dependent oligopeptide transporter
METTLSPTGAMKPENTQKMPNFLKLLFFVEMWERFSYYGMRALLVLFLTTQLGLSDKNAGAIYALFAAICYAGPVLGGILADKLMGFRQMVLIGGVVTALGHLSMAFVAFDSALIYYGLGLIAVGTGLLKGNITNLLGSCYGPGQAKERSQGFTLFYVGVNLGSFLASLSCAYTAHLFGWHVGFSLAGFGMLIGLLTFFKFQYILGENGLSPKPHLMQKSIFGLKPFSLVLVGAVCASVIVAQMLMNSAFFANLLAVFGVGVIMALGYILCQLTPEQRKNMLVLIVMVVFLMFFFAIEMQLGSFINLFADRNVVKHIFGFPVPASVSQAINPLTIMTIGAIIGLFVTLRKKFITARFSMGILSMAVSMLVLYAGCLSADANNHVSYAYFASGIAIMAMGELMMTPLVQEQATLLAPPHLKGFVMGVLMLSLAFSNLAGVVIMKFMAVPSVNGQVDSGQSLAIYKKGFLEMGLFNIGLFVVFLLFYRFVNGVIGKERLS